MCDSLTKTWRQLVCLEAVDRRRGTLFAKRQLFPLPGSKFLSWTHILLATVMTSFFKYVEFFRQTKKHCKTLETNLIPVRLLKHDHSKNTDNLKCETVSPFRTLQVFGLLTDVFRKYTFADYIKYSHRNVYFL